MHLKNIMFCLKRRKSKKEFLFASKVIYKNIKMFLKGALV